MQPAIEALTWPPPPHDPRERICVASVGGWEVRVFPDGDPRGAYLARHGMAHLQLWHPAQRVSVLTPSRLTAGSYELFPYGGWKFACPDLEDLLRALDEEHGLALVPPARLRALETWFVERTARSAPSATTPPEAGRL